MEEECRAVIAIYEIISSRSRDHLDYEQLVPLRSNRQQNVLKISYDIFRLHDKDLICLKNT
jgi:hypothetical protein